MEFCEKCDALLQPRNVNGKIVPTCPDCGAVKEDAAKTTFSLEKGERLSEPEKGKILIVNEEIAGGGRPRKMMYCEKCKSEQMIEYWDQQTRSADESPTQFYRCLACDYNWRVYD